MHGGFRPGSGRKPGFAAKNAEEARQYFSQRVSEEIGSLADVLIEKAQSGDTRALQVLLDRAWGRPKQELQLTSSEQKQEVDPRIWELARKLNR